MLASKQKLAAKAGPPEQVGIDYDDDPFLLGQKTVFYGQTVGFRKASFLCKQKSEEDIRPSTTSSDLVEKKSPGYPHPNEHVKKTSTIDGFGVLDPKKITKNTLFHCFFVAGYFWTGEGG